MMQSIKQLRAEWSTLMRYRTAIRTLFKGIPVSVTIGGSYALRYHAAEFANRETHDYDFIVRGEAEAINECRQVLVNLKTLRLIEHPSDVQASDSGSWVLGEFEGHPIDVILTVGRPCPCYIMEELSDIAKAKLCYKAKYRRLGKEPRQKDIEDLEILRMLLGENHPDINWF